ncbi:MAG: SUMF1/EgtB/PvdO family nonheme iron enzyme [Deltaproteobacteria bacterium]|nr:SUMF1/EgtB/PvdO family nonheme iron enzyme [Deltaproteobacteria bacterium]
MTKIIAMVSVLFSALSAAAYESASYFQKAQTLIQNENFRGAWKIYLNIQADSPEELISTPEPHVKEAARWIALREMKKLIQRMPVEMQKHLEPNNAIFMKAYQSDRGDGFTFVELRELFEMALPYLATSRGAQWVHLLAQALIEQGEIDLAIIFYRYIATYSQGFTPTMARSLRALLKKQHTLTHHNDLTYAISTKKDETEKFYNIYLDIHFPDQSMIQKKLTDHLSVDISLWDRYADHRPSSSTLDAADFEPFVSYYSDFIRVGYTPCSLDASQAEFLNEIYIVPKSLAPLKSLLVLDAFGNLKREEFIFAHALAEQYHLTADWEAFENQFVLIPGLAYPLYMQKTEFTNFQEDQITHEARPWFVELEEWKNHYFFPVTAFMIYGEIKNLIARLNENQTQWDYRLPTQEEWLHALKAGSHFYYKNYDDLERYAWFKNNSPGPFEVNPVALLLPNDFGLFDMLGNASEIVWPDLDDPWRWIEIVGGCARGTVLSVINPYVHELGLGSNPCRFSGVEGFRLVRTPRHH